jgi:hypothetical protein
MWGDQPRADSNTWPSPWGIIPRASMPSHWGVKHPLHMSDIVPLSGCAIKCDPASDMLGIYVLPFIWLFVCTGCRLLHTAERAWLPSYCSPTEPFALSLCLADFWLAQGLITSSGVPAKASTGSTWIIMLYVSSIQVSSRLVKPP